MLDYLACAVCSHVHMDVYHRLGAELEHVPVLSFDNDLILIKGHGRLDQYVPASYIADQDGVGRTASPKGCSQLLANRLMLVLKSNIHSRDGMYGIYGIYQ